MFERLRANGFKTLSENKCVFNKKTLDFYGYIFLSTGISAEPKKVESIQDAAPPAGAAELCSLLGLVNYVSRFIADYATITAPLRELSKKHAKWQWGDSHQKALEEIKNRLTSNIVMACFDPQKRTMVNVDAGPLGLGAILAQSKPSTDDFKVVA